MTLYQSSFAEWRIGLVTLCLMLPAVLVHLAEEAVL
jgi:hypothetical protein